MRLKKWARPELAVCPYFKKAPWELQGQWHKQFLVRQPLFIELGCGKGGFLSQAALDHPEINFLGIDMISDVLGVARRRIERDFSKACRPVSNLLLTSWDISRIDLILSPADQTDRIFINFCNPWYKPKQYKKRLTHTRQLLKYREFLKDGGEIWFKTDDEELFAHSLRYFSEAGFTIEYQTPDLHQSGFTPNYRTEHEEMYAAQGVKIKFLIAKKQPGDFA